MDITILTVMPELLEGPLNHSIVQRAQQKGHLSLHTVSLRDYTTDRYRSVDDYAYGPNAGMVLRIAPIDAALEELTREHPFDEVIYTSPDGEPLTQQLANELSLKHRIAILCGHYKGLDQRVRDHLVSREVSIGDYVLSGGELAAAVIIDCIARLLPGVLSDETSALTDSFQDGLLAPEVYTRPEEYKGWRVPEILLSGNHAAIADWQHARALERTKKLRPDLYARYLQE